MRFLPDCCWAVQKGLAVGLLTAEFFTSVILLILVSFVITPILLKKLYRGSDEA